MKIGVLTGGGDCPGLNAAIRAVARRALSYGWDVAGIQNGWAGMLDGGTIRPLTAESVSGILHLGGTMLGTSRTNPLKREDDMEMVSDNFRRHKLEALVAIGGDDTLSVAAGLFDRGLPTVGVPKTMDNDVSGTDYCIGFNSAVSTVADALDKLHTTASAHHRVLVVEVMGRDAGWVAVVGGLAGGADYVMIPEEETELDDVVLHLEGRRQRGKDFSIIVVSEGAKVRGAMERELHEVDAFGHVRLDQRAIGETVAREIQRRTGFETRVTVLGHLQRGGSPTVFDRVLATRLGVAAVDYVKEGRFGYMAGLQGDQVVPVSLRVAVSANRVVDKGLYELARIFY
ncbi:MAG: 6-phosphofructokinase [Chloroflexi bacterium]|nr:6-phosphofructokinase [Chloroflexota bacterium]MCL5110530.1 6-phosphofructokinase [Chloroflexota bacterium]